MTTWRNCPCKNERLAGLRSQRCDECRERERVRKATYRRRRKGSTLAAPSTHATNTLTAPMPAVPATIPPIPAMPASVSPAPATYAMSSNAKHAALVNAPVARTMSIAHIRMQIVPGDAPSTHTMPAVSINGTAPVSTVGYKRFRRAVVDSEDEEDYKVYRDI